MASLKNIVQAVLVEKRKITPTEAREAMKDLMSGSTTPAQAGAFLTTLQFQGLDPEVVKALAETMVSFAQPCNVDDTATLVDIVGTGGDGLDTFNVSTAAGIVLAACNLRVAKHGNRSATGSVGSADFLEALGCKINLNGDQIAAAIKECGFGFLFAQQFHPAMKHVGPVRKEIGFKTALNLLGPLTNPAKPELQVTGVGSKDLGQLFAELFKLKGSKRALIVHSSEGLDEISPAAATHCWYLNDGEIKEMTLTPADFGLEAYPLASVQGGTPEERAALFREVLSGGKKRKAEAATHDAVKNYIVINAAAALVVAGAAKDWKAAAELAREAIDSGKALQVLDKYAAFTRGCETDGAGAGAGAAPAVPSAFTTRGGVAVTRKEEAAEGSKAVEDLVDALDSRRGMLMMSTFEYPGRYTKWKVGFVDPPVQITTRDLKCDLVALNPRGRVLLQAIHDWLAASPAAVGGAAAGGAHGFVEKMHMASPDRLEILVAPPRGVFTEEERSRQPSVFSVVREVIACFHSTADPDLGLYGAFGYDLTFQFEPCRMRLQRDETQRDLVLFIPDQLLLIAQDESRARRVSYDFAFKEASTKGLPREGASAPFAGAEPAKRRDHEPGEYAGLVERAKQEFACGNLFEVVCSQTFYEPCPAPPSELHRRVRERNPSPYSFFINLGDEEYLVGASPEMYVRCKGPRIETCPISGTIARGKTAIEDAHNIKTLLNSLKEESELTMCTDVDRNDKSRICKPGSVQVIGRRQIEMYSRLIHTVDHVEGVLRDEFDALDAFLAHTWAVTVTGAPKAWAMQFLEDHEKTPRAWYGGAIGQLGFDGNMNTGLTLRTIRIIRGVAQVRAGATLLYDSEPMAEEEETQLKASAFLDAIRRPRNAPPGPAPAPAAAAAAELNGAGAEKGVKRVLLIDHQDSFVHTLANYIRQTGAEVTTVRSHPQRKGLDPAEIDRLAGSRGFDLAVLSPGPGNPTDFNVPGTMKALEARKIPVFGVCLGLQGMVEHFGGVLGQLSIPMHGKPSVVNIVGGSNKAGGMFDGVNDTVVCGRYHSLYALVDKLPPCLEVTALSDDGIIMGVRHVSGTAAAVQFHPESILTEPGKGVVILTNALTYLKY